MIYPKSKPKVLGDAGSREGDKFCRRCGMRLSASDWIHSVNVATSTRPTSSLSQEIYHRVSGGLIAAAVTSTPRHIAPLQKRPPKLLISALLSIPFWLIIMLLSPLDAYATAQTISKRI